jgi:hypothetical protein
MVVRDNNVIVINILVEMIEWFLVLDKFLVQDLCCDYLGERT